MQFWEQVLRVLDTQMETPSLYGWFHILWLVITVATAVFLCTRKNAKDPEQVRRVVLWTAVSVITLEIYKMINYSFSYENGIVFDFQWYAFPWQFCSTPMFVGLLAGLTKKGKLHDALCAYLATFAVFAGLCVMLYPGDVFIGTLGINVQTMICHGSMIWVGVYLYASGYVKMEHKTILRAVPVFATALGIAVVLNEVMYYSGILGDESFNMFYISPHFEGTLPLYSTLVQKNVPYPFDLIIYIAVFALAAYLILLIAMGIGKLCEKRKAKKAA